MVGIAGITFTDFGVKSCKVACHWNVKNSWKVRWVLMLSSRTSGKFPIG
jgi:hypothetical protein